MGFSPCGSSPNLLRQHGLKPILRDSPREVVRGRTTYFLAVALGVFVALCESILVAAERSEAASSTPASPAVEEIRSFERHGLSASTMNPSTTRPMARYAGTDRTSPNTRMPRTLTTRMEVAPKRAIVLPSCKAEKT